jgi:23S rRNA (guanosine2251-2'-O)-methyltransferase
LKKENTIFGIRPVIEALKSGKEIEKIMIQNGLRGEGFHALNALAKELEIPLQFVPVDKLNQITRLNHQGVIATISEIAYQKLESIIPFSYEQGRIPLVLALDRITDVRNLGAIARTAECAGVDGLLLPEKGSARINAVAVKTSAGALYKMPVCRARNLKESIIFLKESGLRIFAASEKGSVEFTRADFSGPLALVMGSEEDGVSEEILKYTDERICIPLVGEIESLNVSVATGIILYEIIRQRKAAEE